MNYNDNTYLSIEITVPIIKNLTNKYCILKILYLSFLILDIEVKIRLFCP